MNPILASLAMIAIHLSALQKAHPNGTPPGGPVGEPYALVPYSTLPASIAVSITTASGTVSRTSNFVEDITFSDSDTFTRTDNGNEVVLGTSKLLNFAIDGDTGIKDESGIARFEAFHQFGQTTTPTFSDSSVVKEVIFENDALAPDAYPLYRVVKYHVTDPVNPPTKDSPGVTVTKLIQVTRS